MGEFYEIIELAGIHYLNYQRADTNWQTKAFKLSKEQVDEAEALELKHLEERVNLLESFTLNLKG